MRLSRQKATTVVQPRMVGRVQRSVPRTLAARLLKRISVEVINGVRLANGAPVMTTPGRGLLNKQTLTQVGR